MKLAPAEIVAVEVISWLRERALESHWGLKEKSIRATVAKTVHAQVKKSEHSCNWNMSTDLNICKGVIEYMCTGTWKKLAAN